MKPRAEPPPLYVATKNAGKLRELKALFKAAHWSVDTYPHYADVEEGDRSYRINAAVKAEALRKQLTATGRNAPVLGDDSGLEIAALGGRPGVLSARYGGSLSWAERRARLLAELDASGSADRRATFVCALHYIDEAGKRFTVEERLYGSVARAECGAGGFSYDSIFIHGPTGLTLAQLGDAHKNRISHRARAVASLLRALGQPAATESSDAAGKAASSDGM